MPIGRSTRLAEREFESIIRARQLETVFQPIVRLAGGDVVGYEALVRGPAGSRFTGAPALLEQAYRTGMVVEFDWAARASACRAALGAGLGGEILLFLNIEPLALGSRCPPDLWPDIRDAFERFQVVLEVTERSLARDPRSLLEGIDHHRPEVAGVAIDDLGGSTPTLSMLPILAPDVIKLDLTVIQAGPSPATTKVLDTAYEEAERTGAAILAEGVETSAQADFARSIGATLGQGHLFGEPNDRLPALEKVDPGLRVGSLSVPDLQSPFDALEGWSIGQADEHLLRPLSHQVAYREVPIVEPALVLVLVPHPSLLNESERGQLISMAQRGVVTGVLGPGMPAQLAPGIRGASTHDRQLDGQWAVIALSPGTASAMLARTLPHQQHVFEFGVTHNRRRVIIAARSLLRRLGPPVRP